MIAERAITMLLLSSVIAQQGNAQSASTRANAQLRTGDYLFLHQGTEAMTLQVAGISGSRVTGQVTAAGQAIPFSGTLSGGRLSFSTTPANGTALQWTVAVGRDTLRATLSDGSSSENYAFIRRGVGWSAQSALAKQWERRLGNRGLTQTERTGGGTFGGAVKDMSLAFCAGGRVVYDEKFALSISVPGLGGGETSRASETGKWRVISSGNTASVEITTERGDVMQLGVRAGEGNVVVVAEQPMRLVNASANCD